MIRWQCHEQHTFFQCWKIQSHIADTKESQSHLHKMRMHSFRISAATIAAAAASGFPAWVIKTLRRWNGNAYLTYIYCRYTAVVSAVSCMLAGTDATNQIS